MSERAAKPGLNLHSPHGDALESAVAGRSLWHDAWRRLKANRAAMVSAALLAIIALVCLIGPHLLPWAYDQLDWDHVEALPPHLATRHYLGTNSMGRDLLARTLVGGRISLMVGLLATAVALLIGVAVGTVAGFVGGATDQLLMRFVDLMYAVPLTFFVIILMVLFGRDLILMFLAIGCVEWLTMARIVRGQTLALREKEFITAARAAGGSGASIILRHIVPNVLGVVIVYVTLTIPQVILLESFLSFLGLGVQEPMTSWGMLIAEGAQEIEATPRTLLIPAAFLTVTLFCFNFLGDGLRDALDPEGAVSMLAIENLTVSFATTDGEVRAVNDVSLHVARGECLGVVGESGSGKSQTFLAALGLLAANGTARGRIAFDGVDLLDADERTLNRIRGDRVAMIFQDPMTALTPHLTIGDQLTEVLRHHRGVGKAEAHRQGLAMLDRVRLPDPDRRWRAYPHELSGGQRQRVMIAMALLCGPELIVADEPTTALDVTVQAQILALLREVKETSDAGIVLVSHDLGVIAGLADRVAVMYAGRIVESGPVRDIFKDPHHPYTRGLLACTPRLDEDLGAALVTIPGQPPNPAALPPGCAFAPRCAHGVDACNAAVPASRTINPHRTTACIRDLAGTP